MVLSFRSEQEAIDKDAGAVATAAGTPRFTSTQVLALLVQKYRNTQIGTTQTKKTRHIKHNKD